MLRILQILSSATELMIAGVKVLNSLKAESSILKKVCWHHNTIIGFKIINQIFKPLNSNEVCCPRFVGIGYFM